MIALLTSPEAWAALLTLTALEIVLGIDNVIFLSVIVQIIIIDMVFSLDSIITAIGMAQDLEIMIAAVVIACLIMYLSSGPVARFVAEHPTTKMLALAFLVLIGVALVADGFGFHIPRGYIYFAIAFSAAVEFFNVLAKRNRRKAVN